MTFIQFIVFFLYTEIYKFERYFPHHLYKIQTARSYDIIYSKQR
jgi:hypothetical protein